MTARPRRAGATVSSPTLLELTNTDAEFYPLVGPFLSRREVVRQVGGTVWDDDAKTWIVATTSTTRPAVTAFVAVAVRGRTFVESLYLVPGYEHLAETLVAAAVTRFGDRHLNAVVCLPHRDAYLASGFDETSRTKNFVTLVREATPR